MNRFLDNLAVRLLNPAEAIQPRTPSRFEPEAAASPRPFFVPETVWEEAEELEQREPHSPETVRPEPDSPGRVLGRRAPIGLVQPSAPSEDAAPPGPVQAARPAFSPDTTAPEPLSFPPGLVREEARVSAPRPSAAMAPVSLAHQMADAEPPAGVMSPAKPLTATDSSASEIRAQPALTPLPRSASRRAEGQVQEGAAAVVDVPLGGRAPLSPAFPIIPARVPAPAEAAVSSGGAMIVRAVVPELGENPVPPEMPGRSPLPVVVRTTPAPVPPSAGLSEPAVRETSPPAPTIQVTIGRIEIRAAASAPRASNPRPAPPKLTLEEYLRDGGRK